MRKPSITQIAEEVRSLHDKDEALSKTRAKVKSEQREVRLRIGNLVRQVPEAGLGQVAERSGYTEARLKDFAFVAEQWPEGTFPGDASYTAMEELARHPDRFALITAGMSKRDARAARGGKVDTPSRWSPETKAAFIAEALSDPDVASQVAGQQGARAAMAEAEWRLREEVRARREAASPGRKAQRVNTELAELIRSGENIRYAVGRLVDKAMELDAAGDVELIEVVGEIKTAVEWLDSYAKGGSTTFESDLQDLLKGN